ncbi:MAG: transposase, partial [bacterium]|nr:transposase [bacterium]
RLAAIAEAGELAIPFTSGILIGIGETREERLDALFALRDLHARHGHIQEIIVQNFRAKPDMRMSGAPEPDLDDLAWTVAAAETGELAKEFIDAAITSQAITKDQLTLHADRGTSMTSKPVAQLLVDLGVARSHSRPHVSNDNPYSEAQFKTLKYCPAFPDRFGSIADARTFCEAFFDYYNHQHRHSGIGLHTPASVHYGTATEIREQRAITLNTAYTTNPARFRHRPPTPPKLPTMAWINQPQRDTLIKSA